MNAGEPNIEEQTQLFIETLNLGAPTATTSDLRVNVTYSVSRRSIPEICGTPSTEICQQSKLFATIIYVLYYTFYYY